MDDKKIVVFTGTSISYSEARGVLDATYRPPIFRGNMDQVLWEGYRIVGIIDGIFFNRAAVAHKEILRALDSGVKVIGGGSMGALRASELDVHGMIGVGRIYGWYRDGVLEDDDEVAVATNPDTFEPVSVPMVNIRETLKAACKEGIITTAECNQLTGIAKKTQYGQRSYLGMVRDGMKVGMLSEDVGKTLLDYCRNHEADVKKEDAIMVLNKIKEIVND
ncbi:TfuA-related McrA-glycine thioamidation protein [uncultured Methanomethylovorans sp.]|uniref:TfuA-related McrA-glycine thioamidation protein n=1 Tax=uncultured Methanomethylovorans sp. TaxID=183759 RepID=UPI002AA65C7B|nr:TfuA-related McrA-glycine thioamidation protein [uncultured Methanomethylovorans sp.]